jgi:MFS family permease
MKSWRFTTKPEVVKSKLLLLFRRQDFPPFFLTQFLGAFNDNLFKTGLSLLIAFQAGAMSEARSSVLVNLAAICFILPFFLFSPRAGLLADQANKVTIIRRIKAFEIVIMSLAAAGFYLQSAEFLILVLFLMGTQSTFFGPLKYSYLPPLLDRESLVGANAWIQASTFIGIILGMMLAGLLYTQGDAHQLALIIAVMTAAVLGWLTSQRIPLGDSPVVKKSLSKQSHLQVVRLARSNKTVWQAIVGISWFWMLGATYITQLPNFVRFYARSDEQVFLFCLGLFAVGVGAGALLGAWMRSRGAGRWNLTIGVLGLIAAGLVVAAYPQLDEVEKLRALTQFSLGQDQMVSLGLLILGVSGGLYIVPLYTVLQLHSNDNERSRMVAVNNILNAAFMVGSAILVLLLLGSGVSIAQLFFFLALSNVVILIYLGLKNRDFLLGMDRLISSTDSGSIHR